jgi:hypothetical protein
MIAVGHTSVGVIVGIGVLAITEGQSPLVAVSVAYVAGVASHYLMDLIPHGHYDFNGENPTYRSISLLCLDLFLPISIFSLFLLLKFGLSTPLYVSFMAIAGAQAPDVLQGMLARGIFPRRGLFQDETHFHMWTHWHNPKNPLDATREGGRKLSWTDLWQVGCFCLAVYLLL